MKMDCVANGNLDNVKILLQDADQHTLNESLLNAVGNKHIHVAEYLLNCGADVNYFDGACIFVAVYNNHLPMVELLLRYGACVNYSDIKVNKFGICGGYSLKVAQLLSYTEIEQLLLKHNPSIPLINPRSEFIEHVLYRMANN